MEILQKMMQKIILFLVGFCLLYIFSCSEQTVTKMDAEKKINLANTFYNNELYQAAIAEYKDYLENYTVEYNKQANIYYQIANIYFERIHDYNKALEFYLRIKYLYPESKLQTDVGKKIVNCLEILERSQDAQRILNKETALKPDEIKESRPGEIIAKVGTKQITQGDLDYEINQLPAYLQAQFNTKQKKIDFLRQYIAEELLYDSAKRKNLDEDKEVIEAAYRAKRQLMAQKILRDEIQKMVDISQPDVELYYKANLDKYAEKDKEGKIIRQKPFQECAQQVAQDLFQEKQQEAYQELIERLMKAENVTIYEKKIN